MATHLQIVEEWHKTLQAKDKSGMAALVKEDVVIGGPRGETEGVDVMLEWIDRANIVLTPKKYFASGNTVIVEELGEWHSAETGEVVGTQTVASVFVVENNLITSIHRYDTIATAFELTGLSEQDSVS
jgi:ketosteroid isomerase-like protein